MLIGSAIAGLWLEGVESAFAHASANSGRSTDHAEIGEFLCNFAVAVAARVVFEYAFNLLADFPAQSVQGVRFGHLAYGLHYQPACRTRHFVVRGTPRTTKWPAFDSQSPIRQRPGMDITASSFKLRANVPESRKQFPISHF